MKSNFYCPIAQLCAHDLHVCFEQALVALSNINEQSAEVAILCFRDDMTQATAAKQLGVSRHVVVRRLKQARHFLQAWFGGDFKTAAANYLYQEP